ncbi:glycosyltransferase family 2 protein [Candidatus Peregrinibacteria bacterium]|nr:glycosyltransferase family 2 protein [Candidatus Peregrinibacteria bacterium]
MTVSVVLPCYNEEGNIERVTRDAFEWFKSRKIDGEVVVTNDGSKDASAQILTRLRRFFPKLVVVTHPVNRGYGAALRSGCDNASGDVIVVMDSDRQFHVEDAATLLPLLSEFDLVTGYREKRADPFMRLLNATMYGLLVRYYLGVRVRDVNCALKAFKRSIWSKIRPQFGAGALYNAELFLRAKETGIAWGEVSVPHYPRIAGTQTGAKLSVILRMFKELAELKRRHKNGMRAAVVREA